MRRGLFHLPGLARGTGAARSRRPSPRAFLPDARPRGGCTARLGGVGSACVPRARLSLALALHPCAAQSFATFRSFGEAASPCARGCKQHTRSLFEATKLN